MIPETPDPPPVSPDPWKAVRAFAPVSPTGMQFPRLYDADAVDAARAADALRHQQEMAEMRQARDEADAVIIHYGFNRAKLEIDALQAKLSTAEATIQQQAAQIADFCMDYRMKCDVETKALHVQREAAEATIASLTAQVEELTLKRDKAQQELASAYVRARRQANVCEPNMDQYAGATSSSWGRRTRPSGEALDAEIAVLEQEARDRMDAERDAEQAGSPERANYSKGRRLATELCVSRLYALKHAALSSSPRPQEPQP